MELIFVSFYVKRVKCLLVYFLLAGWCASVGAATHSDLAVFIAKGYFKGYVRQDASLDQCAAFLNSRGINFSLFDMMNKTKAVTQEDFARVVGQSVLLFSGKAEVVNGCIKKPAEAQTWIDYCLLNDIDYKPVWERFVLRTAEGSLPEVRSFFRK